MENVKKELFLNFESLKNRRMSQHMLLQKKKPPAPQLIKPSTCFINIAKINAAALNSF